MVSSYPITLGLKRGWLLEENQERVSPENFVRVLNQI